ncbi:hypothetical protein FA13DRAFT_1797877 [Coprinellus micaceus]|uniref:Ribonuclease H1 N-terminal domain-containing protein n=1 Tax=Coprinellus micaceus TaxID=71717 RepID=A0A4Y7SPI7_COPMI|nr:hypothetical protein FA13DRAFT_1797877 [Coprinellus micaceus]
MSTGDTSDNTPPSPTVAPPAHEQPPIPPPTRLSGPMTVPEPANEPEAPTAPPSPVCQSSVCPEHDCHADKKSEDQEEDDPDSNMEEIMLFGLPADVQPSYDVPPEFHWYAVIVGRQPGVIQGTYNLLENVDRVPGAHFERHRSQGKAKRAYEDAFDKGKVTRITLVRKRAKKSD